MIPSDQLRAQRSRAQDLGFFFARAFHCQKTSDSNWIKGHLVLLFAHNSLLLLLPIVKDTCKLRSQNNPSNDDFFDDEFGAKIPDPFAAAVPDATVSGKKKKPKTETKPRNESELAAALSKFACDTTLPRKGIETPNKVLLLNLLDARGGPQSSSHTSRVLDSVCVDHEDELGVHGSVRRKRVTWLTDQWKRDNDFETTRNNPMAVFAALSPQSKQIKKIATKSEAPKKTEPEIQSPPPVARSTTKKEIAMPPPAISSPLCIFKLKMGEAKGVLGLSSYCDLRLFDRAN